MNQIETFIDKSTKLRFCFQSGKQEHD